MEKKSLGFQANSSQKNLEAVGKTDKNPIETAAEHLAELFYEQCLFEEHRKMKPNISESLLKKKSVL